MISVSNLKKGPNKCNAIEFHPWCPDCLPKRLSRSVALSSTWFSGAPVAASNSASSIPSPVGCAWLGDSSVSWSGKRSWSVILCHQIEHVTHSVSSLCEATLKNILLVKNNYWLSVSSSFFIPLPWVSPSEVCVCREGLESGEENYIDDHGGDELFRDI